MKTSRTPSHDHAVPPATRCCGLHRECVVGTDQAAGRDFWPWFRHSIAPNAGMVSPHAQQQHPMSQATIDLLQGLSTDCHHFGWQRGGARRYTNSADRCSPSKLLTHSMRTATWHTQRVPSPQSLGIPRNCTMPEEQQDEGSQCLPAQPVMRRPGYGQPVSLLRWEQQGRLQNHNLSP